MAVTVHRLTNAAGPAWDAFVEDHDQGTFFHRSAWSTVLSRAFRHTALHAYTERDGAVTGVLPLMHVKSTLFGNTLISSPFCVYGGPLCADVESRNALYAYARTQLAASGASALEFRFRELPIDDAELTEWKPRDDLYVTFRKEICVDDAANLKAIPRKQRAMVRKAIDNGLTSRADQDVDRLYAIYAHSVRNLGTPVFSRSYFRILREVFSDRMDVVTIYNRDDPVASVLNFYERGEVLPYYGGGLTSARPVAGNDFMYWEVMRRAAAKGCTRFDFGRSKVGTGAFSFKKNWGFTPQPLFHRFALKPGASMPDHNPLNPKYRLFITAWKRLPLPVANTLGPMIVRGVG